MNKKLLVFALLFVILFVFSIDIALSSSPIAWSNCEGFFGYNIGCWLEDWCCDEDKDGNISFGFSITNKYDYAIKNVTLSVEKCSEEIKLDSIESNDAVHVKIDDVCTYTYEESFFESNCFFTFFDENGNLESYNKSLGFPVVQMSKAEYSKMIDDSRKIPERKTMTIIIDGVLIVIVFFIIFIVLKRWSKKYEKR